jgi:hypothetical protein
VTAPQINTLLWAVGLTVLYVAGLFALEYWKAKDEHEKNLITHACRAAIKQFPWVFFILAILFGFMSGHCFGQ